MRNKTNNLEKLIIGILNFIFSQTAGSWSTFVIDKNGHIIDDWNCEDEDICTNNSTNLTAYKQCGKLVEIERSTEKQGSITQ